MQDIYSFKCSITTRRFSTHFLVAHFLKLPATQGHWEFSRRTRVKSHSTVGHENAIYLHSIAGGNDFIKEANLFLFIANKTNFNRILPKTNGRIVKLYQQLECERYIENRKLFLQVLKDSTFL